MLLRILPECWKHVLYHWQLYQRIWNSSTCRTFYKVGHPPYV